MQPQASASLQNIFWLVNNSFFCISDVLEVLSELKTNDKFVVFCYDDDSNTTRAEDGCVDMKKVIMNTNEEGNNEHKCPD